jgi:hypothetical protein
MELDPNTKARVISEFSKRKKVTYALVFLAVLGFLLAAVSYRYDETLTGLSRETEMAIFLSITGGILILAVLYWRCPYCNNHFWWKLQPKSCVRCGVELVVIKEEDIDPDDWFYYARIREKNSLKFGLYFALIVGINMGLMALLFSITKDIPMILLALWAILFIGLPIFIIERVYRQCPKCGYHFGRWVPQKCPQCETWLKRYHDRDWR